MEYIIITFGWGNHDLAGINNLCFVKKLMAVQMAGMGFEPRTETPRARLAILLWDADSDIGERR